MIEFVDEVEDKGQQIVVKTDQEPSIEAVVEDLVKDREYGRTVVEESPKRRSGSNVVVERAHVAAGRRRHQLLHVPLDLLPHLLGRWLSDERRAAQP